MHLLQKLILLGLSILLISLLFSFSKSPKRQNLDRTLGSSNTTKTNTIPDSKVNILLAGDVMLGRVVMIKSLEKGDSTYPFLKVADTLRSADIAFVNLENPIVTDCPRYESGFSFCAEPSMVKGLTFAGIDVVNLANNHSRNFGEKGLLETVKILKDNGILATGLGELITIKRDGQVFGFLGFDFTSKNPTEADLKLIKDSDKKVDILIVGIHWGVEYTSIPTSFQREWARQIIDSGADVIAGHHPHWVQEYELVDGKPVFYSLGNFVFDQMWSEETKKGLVIELSFRGDKEVSLNEYKTYMFSVGQPQIMAD